MDDVSTKLKLVQTQLKCMKGKNEILNNEIDIIRAELQEIIDNLE